MDQLLGQMRQEFGTFDETYVLTQMGAGATPDQAMRSYQQLIQGVLTQQEQQGNGRGARAPRVLAGGGVLPMEGTDVKKASNQQVTDLVAGILSKDNQAARRG